MANSKTSDKAADKAKRAAARFEKMTEGVTFLETWLLEVAQQGLASLKSRPPEYFAQRIARFTDTQMPTVAEHLRLLQAELARVHEAEGWQRVSLRLSTLWLLSQQWRRLPTLSLAAQADVKYAAGWPQRAADLQTETQALHVQDHWWVLARVVETAEPPLLLQREWLYGRRSGRFAQLLQYAFGNVPLQPFAPLGETVPAKLAFFAGNTPLRAVVAEKTVTSHYCPPAVGGGTDWAQVVAHVRLPFAQSPWLPEWPLLLEDATPIATTDGKRWLLDAQQKSMPVADAFPARAWLQGMALSGGRPMRCFALWKAEGQIWPLGMVEGEHYYPLIAAEPTSSR